MYYLKNVLLTFCCAPTEWQTEDEKSKENPQIYSENYEKFWISPVK
jgi:hypothetical protein